MKRENFSAHGCVPRFSFVALMKAYRVTLQDVRDVKQRLLDESDMTIRKLMRDCLFQSPSALEIILAILQTELLGSSLYTELSSKEVEVRFQLTSFPSNLRRLVLCETTRFQIETAIFSADTGMTSAEIRALFDETASNLQAQLNKDHPEVNK